MAVERVLDRRPGLEPGNRDFPIRQLLTTDQPRSYTWPLNVALNQGKEGACVGFAWAHEAAAAPIRQAVDGDLARTIYRAAQHVDPWPGNDYEGTSVGAGAKVMRDNLGWLQQWRWGFSLNDALVAISRKGPAVMGLPWYTGMMRTDDRGYIRPTGHVEGGHAIVAVGVNIRGRYVVCANSWGLTWGVNGRCRLDWDDLGNLLQQQGEVCIPVVRR